MEKPNNTFSSDALATTRPTGQVNKFYYGVIQNHEQNEIFQCTINTVLYTFSVAAVQQAPWIVLAATQMMPNLEAQVDEVRSLATVPVMFNPSEIPMPFINRAINAIINTGVIVSGW